MFDHRYVQRYGRQPKLSWSNPAARSRRRADVQTNIAHALSATCMCSRAVSWMSCHHAMNLTPLERC